MNLAVALTASLTTALTAAVPAATRIVARTGSRLLRLFSRASRVATLAGTAAPLTIAEQPARAAMTVVKEGMLSVEKSQT
jgi:hypothetical protein